MSEIYTPPSTEAYEVAVLRACFDPALAIEVFSTVTADHFNSLALRRCFASAKGLYLEGHSITAEGLKLALLAQGTTEQDAASWVEPISGAEPPAQISYLVKVLASARQRQLIVDLKDTLALSKVVTGPIEKVLHVVNNFVAAQHNLSTKGYETMADVLARVMNRKEPPVVLTPNMGALDNVLRVRRHSLTYVAADSGGGKTAFMVNFMLNIAHAGHHSACASIEMTNDELAVRAGAILAGVDSGRFEDGLLTEAEMEHVQFTATKYADVLGRMHVIDPATLDVDAVHGLVNEAVVKFDASCFFLDYVQRCQAKGPLVHNQTDRVAYVSETLTAIAKASGVPIVALSQLSRADGKKGLSNLKNASQLEHDCHAAAIIHDTGEESGGIRMVEFEMVKNRKGIKGSEVLAFHLASQKMEHSGRDWREVKAAKKARQATAPF